MPAISPIPLKDMTTSSSGQGHGANNVAFENETQDSNPVNNTREAGAEDSVSPAAKGPQHTEVNIPPERCDDHHQNSVLRLIQRMQDATSRFFTAHSRKIKIIFGLLMVLLYFAYFGYAMWYEKLSNKYSEHLLILTCIVVASVLWYFVLKYQGDKISSCLSACWRPFEGHGDALSWAVVSVIFLAVFIFVIVDVTVITKDPYNMVSFFGMLTYILMLFATSKSPADVNWRAVLWGIALQFCLAIFILRWVFGYELFKWIGDRVAHFLDYTDAGSKFLFGDEAYLDHYFAFKVLPTVVFFSAIISALFYMGVMQVLIRAIGGFLERVMTTTTGESMNAAANIFLDQNTSPLVIRPLIKDMTKSELHAVITGGFATVAGSVLAAYISFNIPANHLISASVMSAPAALAISKLFYPETEKSKTKLDDLEVIEAPDDYNIVDALFSGASRSISLVANIAVNLIAALATLEFINSSLTWFGERVGMMEPDKDALTLEYICSYLWFPLPLLMGVYVEDCRRVAELIGVKTFINEFVAYDQLRVFIENKDTFEEHVANNGSWYQEGDDIILIDALPDGNNTVLDGGILEDRSEVIATYALCGFANIGSMGIAIGVLSTLAPARKQDITSVIWRALVAGTTASFLTACIAGIFYQPFD